MKWSISMPVTNAPKFRKVADRRYSLRHGIQHRVGEVLMVRLGESLAADVDHGAGWLEEVGLADVVARFFALHCATM